MSHEHPSFSSPRIPAGEPVPGKTYRADGWAYVDPPTKFSPEMWELLLAVIGEAQFEVLTRSAGVDRLGRPWVRGQLLVSPTGMLNISRYGAAHA